MKMIRDAGLLTILLLGFLVAGWRNSQTRPATTPTRQRADTGELTALSRFGRQRSQVAILVRASASADKAASLMRQRNQSGTVSVIDLLDVERQRLQTVQNLAQAEGELMNDYVALQKSLGLGWSDDQSVEIASTKAAPQ